ncbi:MAG: hypothetical protein JKY08_09710 [Flavobacteriaceae bacterium]|nr:hypothetical protein [Flavobacteriaceae bacterium]
MNKIKWMLLLLIFTGCKTPCKKTEAKENYVLKVQKGVLWQDDERKLYFQLPKKEKWEVKELVIYSNKNDTLLVLRNDDGAKFTHPYTIENNGEIFIIIFEVWEGSGNLSKRKFYNLNTEDWSLKVVKDYKFENFFSLLKNSYGIKDSIYTKKGENYNLKASGLFNNDGELPFYLTFFNYSNPNLNNGLKGCKTLTAKYTINKDSIGGYKLELIDVFLKGVIE